MTACGRRAVRVVRDALDAPLDSAHLARVPDGRRRRQAEHSFRERF
jgi:hypothetical protein